MQPLKQVSVRLVPIAIAFALGVTLAGGVSAVATTSATTVKVCENTHGLVVAAKAKKCPKGSHAVSIAKRGPKGSTGGPGTPGNNGYSVAYSSEEVISSSTKLTGSSAVVSRISSAPAGSYVGTYQANFTNSDTFGNVSCHLAPGGNLEANLDPASDLPISASETAALNGTASFTLVTASEVDLVCYEGSSSDLTVENSDVALIRVNAVVASS